MVTALLILLVVFSMIFINALYVAGEFSSVSARKTRITQLAEEGNSLAKTLLPILQDPHKLDNYIAASQVGITLSSIVLGIYGERQIAPIIAPWIARLPFGLDSSAAGVAASTAIATTLVLIFLTTLQVVLGELLPKSIGIQYPEKLALATVLPVRWSADYLLKPLIVILNGSGALILKLLGIEPEHEHAHVHSPEEIVILVRESHRGGLIGADERQFLQNVFRSSRIQAGDIAIPRNRMVAAPIDRPLIQVLEMAAESAFTRIPIYEGDIDQIVGFVHLRDLFALHRSDPTENLRRILRAVPFVPESLSLPAVWERLDQAQSYLAVVFDEFGGTAGLITREDLIEELFGELQDEFDDERALITPEGEGRVVVRGDMLIDSLNDLLETDLQCEEASTVGGLLMTRLGRVPKVGDAVQIEQITLQVEAVAHNSVTSVRITLPPQDPVGTQEVQ
ncbi:MAG: hemolysin family protein [Anaerolineae bacterium]|jgi:putative hemolysin